MKIGSVPIGNKTVLAPLAGITNLPFRLLAKASGCGLVCSEMISANGLIHGSEKTFRMLDSIKEEKPLSVQIFGSNPDIMARAAEMVEQAGADVVDINFGCAVKKVVKTGSGVALMRTPELAAALLSAVRRAVDIPLTIKIRSGWEGSGAQALAIAEIAQEAGVDAIAVHPRTASQRFGGHADWNLIGKVKARVTIPVIGNGDIVEPVDALRMLSETGCDAVMVGRTAIGNPWIFSQINALLEGRKVRTPSTDQRREAMIRYLSASVKYFGEHHACCMMRSRLAWFVKGLANSKGFREGIKQLTSEQQAVDLINGYMDALKNVQK